MIRNVFLTAAVLSLVLVAQASFGDVLVDRGLPTTGVYATTTSGGADWANRTNIGTGDFDAKDPIWAANPGWGPPEVPGDDFTLPTGAPNYNVTGLTLWLCPNGTASFSDMFNSVSLMLGQGTGTSAVLSTVATTTTGTWVTFPGTSYHLWQVDFPLNFTAPGGTGYSFAVNADAKACDNASGNGESYYIAFPDCTMTGYTPGYPNDSSDGYVKDFFGGDGTFCDSYTFPAVWGGVRAGDISVQVFGAVPEPSSVLLCVFAGLSFLGFRAWRKR